MERKRRSICLSTILSTFSLQVDLSFNSKVELLSVKNLFVKKNRQIEERSVFPALIPNRPISAQGFVYVLIETEKFTNFATHPLKALSKLSLESVKGTNNLKVSITESL